MDAACFHKGKIVTKIHVPVLKWKKLCWHMNLSHIRFNFDSLSHQVLGAHVLIYNEFMVNGS